MWSIEVRWPRMWVGHKRHPSLFLNRVLLPKRNKQCMKNTGNFGPVVTISCAATSDPSTKKRHFIKVKRAYTVRFAHQEQTASKLLYFQARYSWAQCQASGSFCVACILFYYHIQGPGALLFQLSEAVPREWKLRNTSLLFMDLLSWHVIM